MLSNKTTYRVIYGDTDNMGYAYHSNYFRWFEKGRTELFRAWGFTYKAIEEKGYFLPLSDAKCKFMIPVKYDDKIIIEAILDPKVKAGVKFDYNVYDETGNKLHAMGSTKHAFVDAHEKLVRPPAFFKELVNHKIKEDKRDERDK